MRVCARPGAAPGSVGGPGRGDEGTTGTGPGLRPRGCPGKSPLTPIVLGR